MESDCLNLLPSVCEVLADSRLVLHDDTSLEKLLDCFKELIMQNDEQYLAQYLPYLQKFLQSVTQSCTLDPNVFSFSLKIAGLLASKEHNFTLLEERGLLEYLFQPDSWHMPEFWKISSVRYGWLQGLWNMLQHPKSINFFCKNRFIKLVLQLQNDKGLFITSLTCQILAHVLDSTVPVEIETPSCIPAKTEVNSVTEEVMSHVATSLASREKGVIVPALRMLATILTKCREPLKIMFWKHVVTPLEALANEKDDSFTLPIIAVLQSVVRSSILIHPDCRVETLLDIILYARSVTESVQCAAVILQMEDCSEVLKRKATDIILLPLLCATASPLDLHEPESVALIQEAFTVLLQYMQSPDSNATVLKKTNQAILKWLNICSPSSDLWKTVIQELFGLIKKHVCDGRWEVRDSTLEFIAQLTADLKGCSNYTKTLHSSGMISVLFTSLSDLEGYVQASAVVALGEAVTTSDVCSNVQEKAVTQLLSILSQDTQSFPHRAAVKVFIKWLKSPHFYTALEQSISSVLLVVGNDFDWEVKVYTLELADVLMDKSLNHCPCHNQKIYRRSESACVMQALIKLKNLGVFEFLFKCLFDCDRPVSQKACSLLLKLRTFMRDFSIEDHRDLTTEIWKYNWNEEMLHTYLKNQESLELNYVENRDTASCRQMGNHDFANGFPKVMNLCQILELLDLEKMQHTLSLSSDHVINSPQSLMEDILFMASESDENIADCY
ncbi:BRCA1-associated ATM activator 1 [Silurus asotus]|uniref:BRCA1-associated ATM activator 1 n=1 Tax=Silurus asotus TaxID=30991 RepID=A0AAD5B776_SILAS|nr:BRCA1-associated ATM activator 1 [Silurus asotus]